MQGEVEMGKPAVTQGTSRKLLNLFRSELLRAWSTVPAEITEKN